MSAWSIFLKLLRPSELTESLRVRSATVLGAAIWMLLIAHSGALGRAVAFDSNPQSRDGQMDIRLRVVWGGSNHATYQIAIQVEQGQLQCDQQLGIDPYDAGFLVPVSNSRLEVYDANTRFGGCDLRISGSRQTKLSLHLVAFGDSLNAELKQNWTWTLDELLEQPKTEKIDNSDLRVSISRSPGDMLRVNTGRTHFIYDAQEALALDIEPRFLPWQATNALLEYTIIEVESGQEISRHSQSIALDENGNAAAIPILNSAPQDEGVYELRCKLTPKRILPGILIPIPSIERSIQFLVYEHAPQSPTSTLSTFPEPTLWKAIDQHATFSWRIESQIEKLAEQIDAKKRFPLLDTSRWSSLGKMFRLKQTPTETQVTDQGVTVVPEASSAISTLHGLTPNRIHRIAIRTNNTVAQFKTTIWSEASAKKGLNKSVLARDIHECDATRALHQSLQQQPSLQGAIQELLIWPKTDAVTIEVINLSSSEPLHLERVSAQVFRHDASTTRSLPPPKSLSTMEFHSSSVRGVFGLSPSTNVYDDWNAFLNFAETSAAFAKSQGFRRLAMVVDSQGGTLFPSQHFSGNSRFDTGIFFPDAKDPIRKDVIELMYRCLARHQIEFVPMFEFSGQIRELESQRSNQNLDIFQRKNPPTTLAPSEHSDRKYNPISPRVQRAILNCIEEFHTRYHSSPYYRGFALRIPDHSHLAISIQPNDACQSLLDQFYKDTNGSLQSSLLQRDRIAGPQTLAMFQQWCRESVLAMFAKAKDPPRWISTDTEMIASQNSIPIIVPISSDRANSKHSVVPQVLRQWNIESPNSLHIAFKKPNQQIDGGLLTLAESLELANTSTLQAVPQRDAHSSISHVRVWSIEGSRLCVILSNANPVAESIVLHGPASMRFSHIRSSVSSTTAYARTEDWMQRLNEHEYQITIPASSLIILDSDDAEPSRQSGQSCKPNYWVANDPLTMQLLQTGASLLESAANRLSVPSQQESQIANAGFENTLMERKGNWNGWATSIDPTAQVSIDPTIAYHGGASARMELSQSTSVAWLQSDPFPVAVADRLTVTAYIASHEVPDRASLSILRYEPKSDRFERLQSKDMTTELRKQPDANWKPFRFDVFLPSNANNQDSDSYSVRLFRLQIEASGKGQLFIDDVHVSNCSMTEEERRTLRSELFLAKGAMQSGDYGPVAKVLGAARSDWIILGNEVRMESHPAELTKAISSEETISDSSSLKPNSTSTRDPKQARRIRNLWWPIKR